MKQRKITATLLLLSLLAATQTASASQQDAQHEVVDARLEGYGKNVTLNGGTALVWMLLVFLGGVCVVGLFKDAKRSHLD
ncbi:MAG TPA: hypothetical protein VGG19_17350 [Tepidisphaeraceae bacterium]|jgi:hypothetical protein